MAGASNTHTTVSTLEKGYKKTATKLYPQFKKSIEEFSWLDDIPDEEIIPSGRENLIPVDLTRGFGAAMIPDGGYEARTVTPAMNEASFGFVEASSRFYISRFARALDARAKKQQIVVQIKYQSEKAMQSIARRMGLQFYGFSTGYVAESATNTTATSMTLTLQDGFGVSTIDTAAYLSSLFDIGDRIGLIRTAALVTNALGVIDSKPADGELAVTFDGSVDADASDNIVFANAVTDATIAATDYSRWPSGLLDITTSTALHGLTATGWSAAANNTAGGRFGYAKLKAIKQALKNSGGGQVTDIVWTNGVENDTELGERSARIYDSAQMDLDGSLKAKGITFHTSDLVPPTHVFAWDKSAWGKKFLTDKPDEDGSLDFGDLYKAEDRAGWKGGFHVIYSLVTRRRKGFVRYAGLDEQ